MEKKKEGQVEFVTPSHLQSRQEKKRDEYTQEARSGRIACQSWTSLEAKGRVEHPSHIEYIHTSIKKAQGGIWMMTFDVIRAFGF